MLTAPEILQHLPQYGFDDNRSRAVHRAFVEDGVFVKGGGPNRREKLGSEQLARLLIGICCGETIKKVSHTSGVYYDMRDTEGNRFGDYVAKLIQSVKGAKDAFVRKDVTLDLIATTLALHSRLEIDTGFPMARVVTETNDGATTEDVFGTVKDKPSTFVNVRNVAVIPGTVLYRLACGLHFGVWDSPIADAA